MDYFPVYVKLSDKTCLIVGGGEVATRKARILLKSGANLRIVAPDISPAMQQLAGEHPSMISLLPERYHSKYLDDIYLVIAATDQNELNQDIFDQCEQRGILVNIVDHADQCRFIMPSIIDRSPLVVAMASNGKAPVLLRLLRTQLEALIPETMGKLAQLAGDFRSKVKQTIKGGDQRRYFWERVLQGEVAELVHRQQYDEAEKLLETELNNDEKNEQRGEVYLVGAGPGDPELLTFKANRLMQLAEVVLYDRLVAKSILDKVRRDADLIYVGKEKNNHALPQENINQLLVKYAKEGKRVLRLKGGDPFIFGRGGEEIETLMEEGVSFQVVPGITSASGSACYGGIPLTHRDYAQSVVFATGHLKDGTVDLNWQALAHQNQTIVIYMGLMGLPIICENLIKHGLPNTMPAAVVQWATTDKQKVITGDLSTINDLVQQANITSPALVIIGEVVHLRKKLAWFGNKH